MLKKSKCYIIMDQVEVMCGSLDTTVILVLQILTISVVNSKLVYYDIFIQTLIQLLHVLW